MYKTTLALLLLVTSTALSATTVYRWTDAHGNVHFTDEPPPRGVSRETLTLPSSRTGNADSRQPSARVQRIRCRDFQGALVQLQQLDDVSPDDPQWLAAKKRARNAIERWCG
ncbi:DUF4124 domain-containing protein [Alkalilimnicola ehrlichii]|nr:DUF4124 domain-containing protein [Alkalilimnicola ehrlichii]